MFDMNKYVTGAYELSHKWVISNIFDVYLTQPGLTNANAN